MVAGICFQYHVKTKRFAKIKKKNCREGYRATLTFGGHSSFFYYFHQKLTCCYGNLLSKKNDHNVFTNLSICLIPVLLHLLRKSGSNDRSYYN